MSDEGNMTLAETEVLRMLQDLRSSLQQARLTLVSIRNTAMSVAIAMWVLVGMVGAFALVIR